MKIASNVFTNIMDLKEIVRKAPRCRGYKGECIQDRYLGFSYERATMSEKDFGYCEVSIGADGKIYYEPVCRMCYGQRSAYRGARVMMENSHFVYHGVAYNNRTEWNTDCWIDNGRGNIFRENIAYASDYVKRPPNAIPADDMGNAIESLSTILDRYIAAKRVCDPTYNVDIDLVMELQKVVVEMKTLRSL